MREVKKFEVLSQTKASTLYQQEEERGSWSRWLGQGHVRTDTCTYTGIIHESRVVRKTAFCICENKAADQLRGNREADQRLWFRYTDSTIPLLPKYKISSL